MKHMQKTINQIYNSQSIQERYHYMSHKREENGIQILAKGNIHCINKSKYDVTSQSNPKKTYKVEWSRNHWQCNCPDFQQKKKKCKHIHAVIYFQRIDNIRNGLHNTNNQDICPNCNTNKHVINRGKRNNQSGPVQLYYCKQCTKRFTGRPGFRRMKHNASIISASLDLYYRGLSLRQIVEHLEITYKEHVSHGTVYNWIRKYVNLISKYTTQLTVSSSGRWHADETLLCVKGRHLRLWAVLDSDTRFLIASHISNKRGVEDASIVMEKAKKTSKNNPIEIVTDGLTSYNDAIKNELQPTIENPIIHLQGPLSKAYNNKIERFNGSIKTRTKTMGSFQNKESMKQFIDGFSIYYNYIRPHTGLEKKTPAESIGIYKKKTNWLDLIISSSNS